MRSCTLSTSTSHQLEQPSHINDGKPRSRVIRSLSEPVAPAERTLKSSCEVVITGVKFEVCFVVLIFLNAISMAVESEYLGFETGYQIKALGANRPADEIWPWARTLFFVLDVFFGVAFTFELLMKLVVRGLAFFWVCLE